MGAAEPMNEDLQVVLQCTGCTEDLGDGRPVFTDFESRESDPDSIVRCSDCGKKHNEDSLYALPEDELNQLDQGDFDG